MPNLSGYYRGSQLVDDCNPYNIGTQVIVTKYQ